MNAPSLSLFCPLTPVAVQSTYRLEQEQHPSGTSYSISCCESLCPFHLYEGHRTKNLLMDKEVRGAEREGGSMRLSSTPRYPFSIPTPIPAPRKASIYPSLVPSILLVQHNLRTRTATEMR